MKAVIIGGGIAGLSAGIFAQKNGLESVIYEKNYTTGGAVSSICVNKQMIQSSVRWALYGEERSFLRSVWNEVGINEDAFIESDSFTTVSHSGTSVTLWKDLGRLEKELYRLSPDDSKGIALFIKGVKSCMDLEWIFSRPYELFGAKEKMAINNMLASRFSAIGKYKRKSGKDFAEFFSHPSLKFLFHALAGENTSIFPFLFVYGQYCAGKLRFIHHARDIAQTMTETYRRLNGRLHLVQQVKEIEVHNNKAMGVRLENGKFVEADVVISACDPHILSRKLLSNKNCIPFFEKRDKNILQYPIRSSLLFIYSLKSEMKTIPSSLTLAVKDLIVATQQPKSMYVFKSISNADNCLRLLVMIEQNDLDYAYWKRLSRTQKEYASQLRQLGETVQAQLCNLMPELDGNIFAQEALTPIDFYERFGGETGAFFPYAVMPKAKWEFFNGRIETIRSLLLAGQWTFPLGGVTSACLSGQFAINRILSQ